MLSIFNRPVNFLVVALGALLALSVAQAGIGGSAKVALADSTWTAVAPTGSMAVSADGTWT